MRSNNAFQPTLLRVEQIVGILQFRFMLTLGPIYTTARLNADRWAGAIIGYAVRDAE
jgi:hypothetical protein